MEALAWFGLGMIIEHYRKRIIKQIRNLTGL